MARRNRRLSILRETLMVLYEFDSNEQEWEPLINSENANYTQIISSSV